MLKAQQATREDRLSAMGRMAAELAHEIRNPLGSLALFSGMLVEDLAEQEGPLDLARKMQEGVGRLNRVVGNTLAFSRDLRPKLGVVTLRPFWEEVLRNAPLTEAVPWENQIPKQATWIGDPDLLRQVAALYGPNHPQLRWELELPEGPVPAHWDGDMVKRALINFVDNAVAAMTSLLEPIMIIFLAIIVGSIVIAMFMPLIYMIQHIGDESGGGGGGKD